MFPGNDADAGLSFDPVVTAGADRAIEQIRGDAEHEFECDGFDVDTFRDAIQAVEDAGARSCRWLVSPNVESEMVESDTRPVTPTGMLSFDGFDVVTSDAVNPDEAFLLSTDPAATVEPPVVFGPPLVVRSPSLVAVVRV